MSTPNTSENIDPSSLPPGMSLMDIIVSPVPWLTHMIASTSLSGHLIRLLLNIGSCWNYLARIEIFIPFVNLRLTLDYANGTIRPTCQKTETLVADFFRLITCSGFKYQYDGFNHDCTGASVGISADLRKTAFNIYGLLCNTPPLVPRAPDHIYYRPLAKIIRALNCQSTVNHVDMFTSASSLLTSEGLTGIYSNEHNLDPRFPGWNRSSEIQPTFMLTISFATCRDVSQGDFFTPPSSPLQLPNAL